MPDKAGLSLDEPLAALTLTSHRRVTMLLELVQDFSNNPYERAAAGHLRMRVVRARYGPTVSLAVERPCANHR